MRVGFWRIKRMLDALKIAPTVTLNARVCETFRTHHGVYRIP
jgi:allantoinase